MYNYFWEKNPPSHKASAGQSKIFFGIIIGAVIIGGFLYFACLPVRQGLKNPKIVVAPEIKNPQTKIASSSANTGNSQKVGATSDVAQNNSACGAANNTIVTKVIDGDTVVVEGGWHVRLLGMDADEKGYPCYDQARIWLENLVLGKNVVLEKDVSDVDQYGRCLRYIFINNENVDVKLVQEGLAVARFYAPDVKYRAEITAAEKTALQNKIGCKWSGNSQTVK